MLKVFAVFLVSLSSLAFAQEEENDCGNDFLSIQTGFVVDDYSSLGSRIFIEYTKDFKEHYQFGVAYEHSRHLFYLAYDAGGFPSNIMHGNFNLYRKISLGKRGALHLGAGLGILHVYTNDEMYIGPSINISGIFSFKLSERMFLEICPFYSRINYAPLFGKEFMHYPLFNLFPIGIKVRL